MGLNIGTPPSVQDLELLDVATLSSANATITATIPSGYRYIKIVFLGFTTGDPGATAIKMRFNGASANYQSRAYQIFSTSFTSFTNTDAIGVLGGGAVGAAARVMCDYSVLSYDGVNKHVCGNYAALEPTSPTYVAGFLTGAYNSTAEITQIDIVLAASTWTTDSELRIYGGNI